MQREGTRRQGRRSIGPTEGNAAPVRTEGQRRSDEGCAGRKLSPDMRLQRPELFPPTVPDSRSSGSLALPSGHPACGGRRGRSIHKRPSGEASDKPCPARPAAGTDHDAGRDGTEDEGRACRENKGMGDGGADAKTTRREEAHARSGNTRLAQSARAHGGRTRDENRRDAEQKAGRPL